MVTDMIRAFPRALRLAAFASLPLLAVVAHAPATAGSSSSVEASANILRICAAADELPYSNKDRAGFENKIAEALAKAMRREPLFVYLNKPAIYLVRDLLDVNRCDVVMGLDTGDERVLTSKPYYRAPYVFIQRKDTKLEIRDWKSPDLFKATKIGFTPGSPSHLMLEKLGLFREHFNYMHSLTNFQDKRNKYTRVPPQRMVNEVADGTAEVSVNFAPEVASYVKAAGNLTLTVIPDDNTRADGVKIPHHFDQSIGVRKEDNNLLADINAALEKARPDIEEVLKSEGIPLLVGVPRS
ncbi:MAG: methanol oxidation system protein MoxJ [Hyphomicrobium sp.]|jgi:mxaJ protein